MPERFYSEFSTERGNTWRIEIHDKDYYDTATEFTAARPGFELEYHGGENLFSPLMPSTCTVHMMVQTATDAAFIADLSDFEEGRFYVHIIEDPDGDDDRWWVGLLTPESIKIPDEARPFPVQLAAVCGLSTLSRQEFDNVLSAAQDNSVKDRILTALAHIPFNRGQWGVAIDYLLCAHDVRPNTGDATDTFIEDVYLSVQTYDPQLGLRQLESAEEVLEQLLLMMNARLFMYRGTWMILPMGRFCSTTGLISSTQKFDKNGLSLSTNHIIYTNVSIDQVNRHRLGGYFYYLPAIRAIYRDVNYFGNAPFAGSRQLQPKYLRLVGHTATSDPTTLTISGEADTQLSGDQQLKIRGFMAINVPWTYTSVPSYDPQSRVHRFRVELQVRCGTKYLKRNIDHSLTSTVVPASDIYDPPGGGTQDATIFNVDEPEAYTWTTNSASRVHFWTDIVLNGHSDYQGDPVQDRVDFEFQTPTLGTAEDADIEVAIQVRGYNGEATTGNPDAYSAAPTVIASALCLADAAAYIGDGSDNGDVLTYGATLENGATEELYMPVGYYAEGPSDDIGNFNSAALLDSSGDNHSNFRSIHTTTATALNTLLCVDRLAHFGKQQECYQGDFVTATILTPVNMLLWDSKKWAMLSMKLQADADLYDIELVAVETLGTLDPDPADEVKKTTELINSTAGSIGSVFESVERGRRDLMSITADIEDDVASLQTDVTNLQSDVTDINRTTDADGGASSIQLQYLGDVKISGPADGQVLEYNSTAGRWANVTPSTGSSDAWKIGEVRAADLVAHWDASNSNSYPFSGGTVTDVVGSVTLSLNNGCYWQRVAGIESFVFDGVNDDLGRGDTPSDLQFQFSDAFSIGIWIKPEFSDTDGFMVFCGNPDEGGNFDGISFINGATNARLTPRIWLRASGSSFLLCEMNGSLTQGAWQYLVMTYAGSKAVSSVKFYLNGTEVTGTTGTDTGAAATINHAGNKYTIGSRDSLNSFYGGLIADVHVYEAVLTAQQVSDNYDATKPKFML